MAANNTDFFHYLMGHTIIDVSCVIIFVGKAWKAMELVEDAPISGLYFLRPVQGDKWTLK